MEIKAEQYGRAVILRGRGELTEEGLAPFAEEVNRQLAGDVLDVILDLSEVAFMDSVWLEYLLGLRESLSKKQGHLTLCGPGDNIAKILESTRLDGRFETVGDAVEAIGAV
ncbi:MAG: STAS domain-containing protein [Planctomycetes bacterium]|nr:STAS domain-containing protein [Planctomycetota bacterium]